MEWLLCNRSYLDSTDYNSEQNQIHTSQNFLIENDKGRKYLETNKYLENYMVVQCGEK